MRRFKLILISVLLPQFILGQQNFVRNGSFEESVSCPPMDGQWTLVSYWTSPNQLSADYFHMCAPVSANYSANVPDNINGFQNPYNGQAYMGIVSFHKQQAETREFIQTELVDSLTAGIRYAIGFQACAADRFQYAISTLGAAVTESPPPVITVVGPNGMVDAVPQVMLDDRIPITDTAKWVLISDTVLAQGGERYLSIGNFNLDGDSDTLRFNPNQPPIYGSPTTYAYYYIDDVFVYAIDSVPSGISPPVPQRGVLEVWPNPARQVLNIKCAQGFRELRLLDMSGRGVVTGTMAKGHHTMNLNGIRPGMYLLESVDENGRRVVKKVLKE